MSLASIVKRTEDLVVNGEINEKGVIIKRLDYECFSVRHDGLVRVVVGTEALRRDLLILAVTKNL